MRRCPAGALVFPGGQPGEPLRPRTVERIVREAAAAAGIGRPCSAMTLRHSYAAHCLARGVNVRALQEALGHARIETTLLYTRLTPPPAVSPLDLTDASHFVIPVVLGRDGSPSRPPHGESPYGAPPSLDNLELPFLANDPKLADRAAQFCRLLRTRLRDGFLALRRATRTG